MSEEKLFYVNINLGGNEIVKVGLEKLATDPTIGNFQSRIFYNTTDKKIKIYNGTTWDNVSFLDDTFAVTRSRIKPVLVTGTPNTLTLNFSGKNEIVATKDGGGGILISSDFTIIVEEFTNAEFAQFYLNVTASATITLPENTITKCPLTLAVGKYQAVLAYDGAFWHFVISEIEVSPV